MNRMAIGNDRLNQLRAVENALLNPDNDHPEDPTVSFSGGMIRVSSLPGYDFRKESLKIDHESTFGPIRRSLRGGAFSHRHQPIEGRRRHDNARAVGLLNVENVNEGERNNRDNAPEAEIRRPLSPTQLPGVRAIPKEYNRAFRGLLTPGEYFAKSHTRYLGPFDELPTVDNLPSGDNYILLQRMGRLPESGKSIFRQVGSLLT